MSLKDVIIKFNIPDTVIIVKWKKNFADFGLVELQPKQRGKPKSMDTIKRKKRKSDRSLKREEKLL